MAGFPSNQSEMIARSMSLVLGVAPRIRAEQYNLLNRDLLFEPGDKALYNSVYLIFAHSHRNSSLVRL